MSQGGEFLKNLIVALLIYMIGKMVVKMLTNILVKVMEKSKIDTTLIKFLSNMVYSLLLAFVVLAALERLGVETTNFAAIIAAAGLAVGFALQGSLGNFASGVMLIIFKPFKIGDLVEVGGTLGVVEEISVFTTTLKSGDNKWICVPNGGITGGNIINYSAKPTRRVDMVYGCGYGDDLKAVKAYLEEAVKSHPKVLAEPAPTVAVSELGDNSVNFVVRPWCKTEDYWAVWFDMHEQIKLGMDERGFSIPYPQRDVHMHTVTAA
ncbi:MAG: mechanosensitive ion channel [Planctomycetes bacterium]|nr:mechanosensitive ion channel [Planctomycetota bacterium]